MDKFDLIEWQERAKSTSDPKKLFELWNTVCSLYDKGQIGKYELEEMKDVIHPGMIKIRTVKELLRDPGERR